MSKTTINKNNRHCRETTTNKNSCHREEQSDAATHPYILIDQLIDRIDALDSPICVGLDPTLELIPDPLKEEAFSEFGKTPRAVGEIFAAFGMTIIDAIYDIVPAVKPQIAMYESYGLEGLAAYQAVCRYAASKGLIVIGDIKRGDISSTASAYAAHLSGIKIEDELFDPWHEDFITVNPYLGSDGITPFTKACQETGKGIFILVRTSNPSSSEIQELELGERSVTVYAPVSKGGTAERKQLHSAHQTRHCEERSDVAIQPSDNVTHPTNVASLRARPAIQPSDNVNQPPNAASLRARPAISSSDDVILGAVPESNPSDSANLLYQEVARLVSEWGQAESLIGTHGYSSVGAVVGATHPEEGAYLRATYPEMFFLVPGYGAQGATASDISKFFDTEGRGCIVNSSRGIIGAWKKSPARHPERNEAESQDPALSTQMVSSALELVSESARAAAIAMRDDLRNAIKKPSNSRPTCHSREGGNL